MTERIILSIFSLLMLILTLRKGDSRTILLTTGLTIGILINWTRVPIIITVGLIIYMLAALTISFLTLRNKELSKIFKVTITLAGLWAFVANLFSIMHWPYAEQIRLSMTIPIILYLISLINGIMKRKEFGYLTIMNVDFVLRLIR